MGGEVPLLDAGEIVKKSIKIIGPDGSPIINTKILFNGIEYITDHNGNIYLYELSTGTYEIELSINGQKYQHKLILGEEDLNGDIYIRLENKVDYTIYYLILFVCILLLIPLILLLTIRKKNKNKRP